MQRVRLRAAVGTRGKGALVRPSNSNNGGPPMNVSIGQQPQYEIAIIIYDHNNNNFD